MFQLKNFIKEGYQGSFKKKAIEIGVAHTESELIITTDADCIMGEEWLNYIVSYYEANQNDMIAAPVNFYKEGNLLQKFQSLDFTGMMGMTGAGIQSKIMRMCNGANLIYTRAIFDKVGGFEGNEDRASGDDMFLMHKVAAHEGNIAYLKQKEATVYTEAKKTWLGFYRQRVRWATKNAQYDDYNVLIINSIVYFTCYCFFVGLLFTYFNPLIIGTSVLLVIIFKGIADYFLLSTMSTFFNRKDLMRYFIPSFFLHIAYIFFIGILANMQKEYIWKGRKVK